jgi:cell pole-organizing protein PopZ
MTQPAKSQEPSMEEILASIRRIIADDDASKSPAKPAETPRPASRGAASPRGAQPVSPPAEPQRGSSAIEAEDEDLSVSGVQDTDILDLTESMAVPAFKEQTQMSQPASVEKFQDHSQSEDVESELVEQDVSEVEEELSFGPVPSPEPERMEAARVGVPGVSERGQLLSGATSAAVDSAFNALAQTVLVHNARTLEDLVREMLRPMLKTWLDDNLPGLVERLVRAEIERVARGR